MRELGIALVCWSPLGGGFLTGTVGTLDKDDFRQNNPRYAGDNLARNLDRFTPFMQLSQELNVTPSQLALAWLLHQGDDIFPIPGTRRPERINENAAAAQLRLDSDTLERINQLAKPGLAEGATLV